MRPYPSKVWSTLGYLTARSERQIFPALAAWISILTATIGFIFFFLFCQRVAGTNTAVVVASILITNQMMLSYLGRPLTDPTSWMFFMGFLLFFIEIKVKDFFWAGIFLSLAVLFRLQTLFIVPFWLYSGFHLTFKSEKATRLKYFALTLFPFVLLFLAKLASGRIISGPMKTEAKSEDFYLAWYVSAFSKLNGSAYWSELKHIVSKIVSTDLIFLVFFVSIAILFLKDIPKRLKLIWLMAAFAFLTPIIIYSASVAFETRYLIYSFPIFALTTVMVLSHSLKKVLTIDRYILVRRVSIGSIFLILIGITFSKIFSFSPEKFSSFNSLNLPLAKPNLSMVEPIILTNKSATTLITGSNRLVLLPPFQEFYEGQNQLLNKIVIFFDQKCDFLVPDEALGWRNKEVLIDASGVSFKLMPEMSTAELKVYIRN